MLSSTDTIPYSDPGMLQGGVREHRAALNNLQADAFRSASQSQGTAQAARAFSGSNVTNTQTQSVTLSQTADASNSKAVTIAAIVGTNAAAAAFDFNYLQRYIAGADAADFLARGAANIAQEQSLDQGAFGKLNDFGGVESVAQNSVGQDVQIVQQLDVDLGATVEVTTRASELGHAFNQSRFRTIEADLDDHSAQAVFTTAQRQGNVDASLSQVAVADGAKAENTMVQAATIIQFSPETVVFPVGVQTTVDLVAAYILDVDETAGLPPRSTDLMVRFNADGGTNSAINSSAASQEQAILQTAAGGVDEDGAITENGGTARNTGASSASNVEGMRVTNSISVSV